jgi:hypothetical protein
MRRKQALTIAVGVLAVAAVLAIYLSRLMTEDQCDRLLGAIDFEARVCIIRKVGHPLREAAIRLLTFWGVVVLLISGAAYGVSRVVVALWRRATGDGAA